MQTRKENMQVGNVTDRRQSIHEMEEADLRGTPIQKGADMDGMQADIDVTLGRFINASIPLRICLSLLSIKRTPGL